MEDDQIEEWFESEKEKLQEEFFKGVDGNTGSKKSHEEYDKKMANLLAAYEKKYNKMWKEEHKHEDLNKVIDGYKKQLNKKIKVEKNKIKEWLHEEKEKFEKFREKTEKKRIGWIMKWIEFRRRHRR